MSKSTDPLTYVLDTFDRPFRELATELACRHLDTHFSVLSCPVGSGVYLGHMLYLECSWPGRAPDEPDNVSLEISLGHLTIVPRVNADVCWGQGTIEAEFASEWSSSDNWPEATPAVLQQLSAKMPELMDMFRGVVARGWPTEPDAPDSGTAPDTNRT